MNKIFIVKISINNSSQQRDEIVSMALALTHHKRKFRIEWEKSRQNVKEKKKVRAAAIETTALYTFSRMG